MVHSTGTHRPLPGPNPLWDDRPLASLVGELATWVPLAEQWGLALLPSPGRANSERRAFLPLKAIPQPPTKMTHGLLDSTIPCENSQEDRLFHFSLNTVRRQSSQTGKLPAIDSGNFSINGLVSLAWGRGVSPGGQ